MERQLRGIDLLKSAVMSHEQSERNETAQPLCCGNLGLNIHSVESIAGGGWKDTIIINPEPPAHRGHRKSCLFVIKAKEPERKLEYRQLPLPEQLPE